METRVEIEVGNVVVVVRDDNRCAHERRIRELCTLVEIQRLRRAERGVARVSSLCEPRNLRCPDVPLGNDVWICNEGGDVRLVSWADSVDRARQLLVVPQENPAARFSRVGKHDDAVVGIGCAGRVPNVVPHRGYNIAVITVYRNHANFGVGILQCVDAVNDRVVGCGRDIEASLEGVYQFVCTVPVGLLDPDIDNGCVEEHGRNPALVRGYNRVDGSTVDIPVEREDVVRGV